MERLKTSPVEIWKFFITSNALLCYSQKVHAAFQYLSNETSQYFMLKDIADKGAEILLYLGIDMDVATTFAVMDVFRHFDRTGSGKVFAEEFFVGIVEYLASLACNNNKLESIALDMMVSGKQSVTELLHLISETATDISSSPPSSYKTNLSPINYLIKSRLLQTEKKVEVITVEILTSMFKDAIEQAIADLQSHFHISNEKMGLLITEFASSTTTSTSSDEKSSEDTKNTDTLLKSYLQHIGPLVGKLHPSVWHMTKKHDVPQTDVQADYNTSTFNNRRMSFRMSAGSISNLGDVLDNMNGVSPRRPSNFRDLGHEDGPITRHRSSSISSSNHHGDRNFQNLNYSFAIEYLQNCGFDSSRLLQNNDSQSAFSVSDPSNLTVADSSTINADTLDSSELCLLQSIYMTFDNFLELSCGDGNVDSNSNTGGIDYKAELLKNAAAEEVSGDGIKEKLSTALDNMKDGFGLAGNVSCELVTDVTKSHDKLKRMDVRIKILEMLQKQVRCSLKDESAEKIIKADVFELFHEYAKRGIPLRSVDFSEFSADFHRKRLHQLFPPKKTLEDGEEFFDPPENVDEEAEKQSNVNIWNSRVLDKSNYDDALAREATGEVATFESVMDELNSLKGAISERVAEQSPLGKLLSSTSGVIPLEVLSNTNKQEELGQFMSSVVRDSLDIQMHVKNTGECESNLEKLKVDNEGLKEQIVELKSKLEQKEHEGSDYIASAIELQMLREEIRVQHLQVNMTTELQIHNHELQKVILSMKKAAVDAERKVEELQSTEPKEISSVDGLKKNYQHEVEELTSEKIAANKEVQRLLIAVRQSEHRTKSALEDELILRQRLNKAEEELSGSKAFVTKLLGDIELEKNQRTDRDDLDRKVQELQRVIATRNNELVEAKESALGTRKLKLELIRSEEYAAILQEKIGELSGESERGHIAIEHLDSYREQVRQKTKEARDMSLQIHSLEAELKEVKQFQAKHRLMEQELHELRVKSEKFPALLAEVARLRGTTRSAAKALQEQDKSIASSRDKMKSMESDFARVKSGTRAVNDVESKLKEANIEIKRLQSMVGEISALKASVKHADEEKKNMEDQYKKMRKLMRQSMAAEGPGSAPKSTHAMFGGLPQDAEEENEATPNAPPVGAEPVGSAANSAGAAPLGGSDASDNFSQRKANIANMFSQR